MKPMLPCAPCGAWGGAGDARCCVHGPMVSAHTHTRLSADSMPGFGPSCEQPCPLVTITLPPISTPSAAQVAAEGTRHVNSNTCPAQTREGGGHFACMQINLNLQACSNGCIAALLVRHDCCAMLCGQPLALWSVTPPPQRPRRKSARPLRRDEPQPHCTAPTSYSLYTRTSLRPTTPHSSELV